MKASAMEQKCFCLRGAKLWNSFPAETNQASSINTLFMMNWGFSGGRVAGALVVPVLGVGWVGNGDLFLSFRCRPRVHRAWGGSGWLLGRWMNSESISLGVRKYIGS